MKIPYNCLSVCGNVLFAARGGKIHSFSLDSGSHLSSWKHPDLAKFAAPVALKSGVEDGSGKVTPVSQRELEASNASNTEHPAKRLKTSDGEIAPIGQGEERKAVDEAKNGGNQNGKPTEKRKRSQNHGGLALTKGIEHPLITLMTTTSDRSHLLAVSSHDKSLWVFERGLGGHLKQLSQRAMPKRPWSVLIAPDNKTVLCADKFGDVYSLPLIEAPKTEESSQAAPSPAKRKAYKPEATTLTVHSAGNLRALESQRRQMENGENVKSEGPTFEHSLVLGHVSILTALTLGFDGERKYIITADRDEHIRVTRYMPQTHIIENFCFGHTSFVSALTVSPRRPDVLISGGGDDELFLWNWRSGRLLSKHNILEHALEIRQETSQVAVSGLSSAIVNRAGKTATVVFVICEDLPGLFVFELTEESSLVHLQTVTLSGNPLHLSVISTGDEHTRALVAIDSGEPQDELAERPRDIVAFSYEGEKLVLDESFKLQDQDLRNDETELSVDKVRSLLYNTESLRKRVVPEEGPEPDLEVAADPEAA